MSLNWKMSMKRLGNNSTGESSNEDVYKRKLEEQKAKVAKLGKGLSKIIIHTPRRQEGRGEDEMAGSSKANRVRANSWY